MWLVKKLNEIKQKYRAMATACLLRTRLAFVGEVQNYYQAARGALNEGPPRSLGLGDETDTQPQSDEGRMNDEQQNDSQQDQMSNQQQ